MTYNVRLSPHAAKQYQKLDPSIKPQIRSALETLQHQPLMGPKIKQLKGRLHTYHRYRMGDYRIAYVVNRSTRTVYVDYIQHRKDIYQTMS